MPFDVHQYVHAIGAHRGGQEVFVILRLIATIGLLGAGLVAPVHAEPVLRQTGTASIYPDIFEGRATESGDIFRQHALTAASRSLPLGSRIRVTNPDTGRIDGHDREKSLP